MAKFDDEASNKRLKIWGDGGTTEYKAHKNLSWKIMFSININGTGF